MATELSGKSVLLVDHGLFASLAETLARDFARVAYFCDWKEAFPRREHAAIGEGLEGVERVWDLWDAIDAADLIVFPDSYSGDLQEYLRRQGKRVWGAAAAEWMELDRVDLMKFLKDNDLPVPKYAILNGLTELKQYLSDPENENLWVKVNVWRGNCESFHHQRWLTTEPLIKDLERDLGPVADQLVFLAEEGIDGVEFALDLHTVDGLYPDGGMLGIEVKDAGYAGVWQDYGAFPECLRRVQQTFSSVLRQDQARTAISLETRVTKDLKPYVIDPCLRCGSPVSEVWMEQVTNLADVIWEGADGRMVSPIPSHKYGVIAVIKCDWALRNWTALHIPEEYRRWVKLKNVCRYGDYAYYTPGALEMRDIGGVVGLGDSLDEAIDMATQIAKSIQGYQVCVDTSAFDRIKEEIQKAEEMGIRFK